MKKIMMILMTACITLFANPSKATVSVSLRWFASWDVAIDYACESGIGFCIQVWTLANPNATFTVTNKETLSSVMCVNNVSDPDFKKFIQGAYIVIPGNSNINPTVTKAEGLTGSYTVPAGKYLYTVNPNGSYSFGFTLKSIGG